MFPASKLIVEKHLNLHLSYHLIPKRKHQTDGWPATVFSKAYDNLANYKLHARHCPSNHDMTTAYARHTQTSNHENFDSATDE